MPPSNIPKDYYFDVAASALSGMLANPKGIDGIVSSLRLVGKTLPEVLVTYSFDIADAMIAEAIARGAIP